MVKYNHIKEGNGHNNWEKNKSTDINEKEIITLKKRKVKHKNLILFW